VKSEPPRFLRALLLLLPAAEREYVAGDLDEEYARWVRPRLGARRAALWYASQVVATVASRTAYRLSSAVASAGLGRALRGLRRTPSFTVLVVGMLALGIGSVTAMYGVIDQVLLRPLPVEDQDRLVVGWNYHRARSVDHFPVMHDAFSAIGEGVDAFEAVAAHDGWAPSEWLMTGADESIPVRATRVLGDFFGVVGVEPIVGRALVANDDVPGADRVAVISEGFWAREFGRSPAAVGAVLAGRYAALRIVGVMPADFDYPRGSDLWTPLKPFHPEWDRRVPLLELDLVARLRSGASLETAAEQIVALYPNDPELDRIYGNTEPRLFPFADVALGRLGPTLVLLFAGSVLVLIVAAINVANLVLIRAAGRESAVALRVALGADRGRLLREAMGDAGAIGLLAAMGGALVTFLAIRFVLPWAPTDVPRLAGVAAFDGWAFLGALAATTALATVAAILPVWRSVGIDPARLLNGAGRGIVGRTGAGLRSGLVAAQIALAVWVLTAGGLLARTVRNLQSLDLGFEADALTFVALETPPTDEIAPGLEDRYEQVAERLVAQPDIIGVTPVLAPPLAGPGAWQTVVFQEGQSSEAGIQENPYMIIEVVQPSYFGLLDVPLRRGRYFAPADDESTGLVTVVNQLAARALWPDEDAVGQRVRAPFAEYGDRWWTVVGVVGDTRYAALEEPRPTIYFAMRQLTSFTPRNLLVRTTADAGPLLPRVGEAFLEVDPTMRPQSATLVSSTLAEPLARPLLGARLLVLFAGVTLLLAVAGVYGVMAYTVRTNRRAIGVRLACGATPAGAAGAVLRQAAGIVLAGAAAGTVAALASGRVVEGLLFGVSATDPTTIAGAAGVVLFGASVACWWPARRAAGVDAGTVLRGE
jgi:predicted permease